MHMHVLDQIMDTCLAHAHTMYICIICVCKASM